jgi:hypothetical protein
MTEDYIIVIIQSAPPMRGSESIDCYPFHGITPCSTVADTSNRLELHATLICLLNVFDILSQTKASSSSVACDRSSHCGDGGASITHCSLYTGRLALTFFGLIRY